MGRFVHPEGRRFLCSCAPTLGFAFLPKCPLCLAAGLAWLGISIPISRSVLTFLLLCAPVGFLFIARRPLPLLAGVSGAALLLAGQMEGIAILLAALYWSQMGHHVAQR